MMGSLLRIVYLSILGAIFVHGALTGVLSQIILLVLFLSGITLLYNCPLWARISVWSIMSITLACVYKWTEHKKRNVIILGVFYGLLILTGFMMILVVLSET